jgi:hypothetical protein
MVVLETTMFSALNGHYLKGISKLDEADLGKC